MKNNKKPQVSAIVPVFNEGGRVGKVIDTLLKSDLIDEVICINDGSSDGSLKILKGFGNKIKLINFKKIKVKVQRSQRELKKQEEIFYSFVTAI
ncbi:MAG: hypothetical protein A2958_02935 [Candidatus Levybacteria bacterium RIFCSPLOWO2_01_FULL_38_13]|nr:MAG: hypothetical protein A2629_03350 [Candidatus Levybacteria bacterium RIFCSPHIGHO2_01_FULL_41_15]OGH35284.1 MAG: hypothetical protein A2958_02935 [Candidatus Levybacteria bacterium RIFCSPLOWO2_01_FULL_38_13]